MSKHKAEISYNVNGVFIFFSRISFIGLYESECTTKKNKSINTARISQPTQWKNVTKYPNSHILSSSLSEFNVCRKQISSARNIEHKGGIGNGNNNRTKNEYIF